MPTCCARPANGGLDSRSGNDSTEPADWELRVEHFFVFYDVVDEGGSQSVKVKAVGHKVHNKLFVGQKEVTL